MDGYSGYDVLDLSPDGVCWCCRRGVMEFHNFCPFCGRELPKKMSKEMFWSINRGDSWTVDFETCEISFHRGRLPGESE